MSYFGGGIHPRDLQQRQIGLRLISRSIRALGYYAAMKLRQVLGSFARGRMSPYSLHSGPVCKLPSYTKGLIP